MRPATPSVSDREDLADRVVEYASRIDARLGACIARFDDTGSLDIVAAHEPDRPYTAASVIKLPVLAALYRKHDGRLASLDEPRPIAPENDVGGSGVLHLFDGGEPTVRDLSRAMIAISDNAATNELIDHVGVDAVNDTAAEIGMSHTHLGRKMMVTLDHSAESPGTESKNRIETDPGVRTNVTAPLDCGRFFRELYFGDLLSDRASRDMLESLRNQKDISMFARYAPDDVDIGHKTGWLPDAALDTGVVGTDADRPLFFAVFVDDADHGGDATDIIAELGDLVLEWDRQAGR